MEIAIIGVVPPEQLASDIEGFDRVIHYSVPADSVLERNKHIYDYLNDWLNIPIEEPTEQTMIVVANSEEFIDMPLYPAKDSIQVVDGRVVVKIQETYTPKQDFEIAYENRR